MKNNKYLPYLIFGVPALVGLFFVYKYIKGNKKGQNAPSELPPNIDSQTETKQTSNGKTTTQPAINKYFPLKKGSKGAKVTELQEAILKYDNNLLGKYRADGDFGSVTEKAVQTILGKTSVDSQEDIATIIDKANKKRSDAETQSKQKKINDSRINLANSYIDYRLKNKNSRYRAIQDVQVREYDLTTNDLREYNPKLFTYHKGEEIPNDIFSEEVDSQGFMIISVRNPKKSYHFSPYGFELI